jgi:NAD(P)-dependent dehydrogenase (short-subunit alcohol dehydrogenase family)
VVTGATSGIGLAVVELLLENGAGVIGIGRSPQRCEAAREHLGTRSPSENRLAFIVADLAIQAEVVRAAREARTILDGWSHPHLDALINNGATVPFWQTLTPEGFDVQWAVNHLAPFLLTNELLPRLRQAARGRVVTVSSGSHRQGTLDWEDIQHMRRYSPLKAYCTTKLANILFSVEFNRRHGGDSSVRAFAADPGLVNTDIGLKSNSFIARAAWSLRRRGGVSPLRPAAGIVFLATDPGIQESHEVYWRDRKPSPPSAAAVNPGAARQLWDLSAQMCGLVA